MDIDNKHPGMAFGLIGQLGIKAFNAATEYEPEIVPRLPPGTLPALAADTQQLADYVPGQSTTQLTVQAATANQEAAVRKGHSLVSAMRHAVTLNGAPEEVQKAYGVGARMDTRNGNSVRANITLVVNRALAHPEEALAAGILPQDVVKLQACDAAIAAAEQGQDQLRAAAPHATLQRNQTANRILGAVDRISAAGEVAFADNFPVRDRFRALRSRPKKPSNGAKAPKAKAPKAPVVAPPVTPPDAPAPADPAPAPSDPHEPPKP